MDDDQEDPLLQNGDHHDGLAQPPVQHANRRNPARINRKYSPLYGFLLVPAALAIRIKPMTEDGGYHNGTILEIILLCILFVPGIIFTFFYPIKQLIVRQQVEHSPLASLALRILTSLLSFFFVLYELMFIFPCIHQMHHGNGQQDFCSWGTVFERILELSFLVGLAVFVFFNKLYPRDNKYHLLTLTHICSSTIYIYIIIMIQEEIHIYKEIEYRHNSSTVSQLPIQRGYGAETGGECTDNWSVWCFLREYIEMFYVAITEFLVVAISIVIGIIYEVGRVPPRNPHRNGYNWKRMVIWVGIFLVAVAIQIFLIFLNVQKADPDNWVIKSIFTLVHVGFLIGGTVVCFYLLLSGHPNVSRSPYETLDRYLLYFGTAGMLFYTCAGIVHCAYLLPTRYSTKYALGSLFVNVSSLLQVLAQTATILHRDMTQNRYWAGIFLWIVNFVMFCLDLFDAATLGIYSNPVPHGSNIAWTMFVRGLGPFDVFYRFHSLAVIAENIEHHLNQ